MSVNYSLILKKTKACLPLEKDCFIIKIRQGDSLKDSTSSLSIIDFGTSHYTKEELMKKYASEMNEDPFDIDFAIRYKLNRIREIPCIFNDKYIGLITDPNLKFFEKTKEEKIPNIWDDKDLANSDSLFYPKIHETTFGILPLKLKKDYAYHREEYENHQFILKGVTSRKSFDNPNLRDEYGIVAVKPSLVLTHLFYDLFYKYNIQFEEYYNKELFSMVMYDPYENLKSIDTKNDNTNTYEMIDYFKRDKSNKNELSKGLSVMIEHELSNYTNFRKCYYIVKKFCVKEIGMSEDEFINNYFYCTVDIAKLDTFKPEDEYVNTSLFKK